MSRPRTKGWCRCGHKFTRQPAPTRTPLDPGVLVELLHRHPRLVGISGLADSVDQSVRWSA